MDSYSIAPQLNHPGADEAWRSAAKIVLGKTYLPWEYAGGPNECSHGIAKGIACRGCDEAAENGR